MTCFTAPLPTWLWPGPLCGWAWGPGRALQGGGGRECSLIKAYPLPGSLLP